MNNEIKVIKVIDVICSPYFMDKNDGGESCIKL